MSSSKRGGFVLPTTLLVMTLLTVMLTAAFVLASAEYRSTDNSAANGRALSLATAGMESYFASNRNLDSTSTYDSVRITLSGGYADVVAHRIRANTANKLAMWVVRSLGTSTDPLQSGQVQAERAVAQIAELNNGQIPARSALTALNGDTMTSTGSNPISGSNADIGSNWVIGCTTPISPGDDTASVTVSTGTSAYFNGGAGGSYPNPTGSIKTLASVGAVYDSVHVDWPRVLAGDFSPDYVGALPADCAGNSNHCPYDSHYFSGNVTVPSSPGSAKRGLLVATGDVTMANGSHWDGIIIAGGRLIDTNGTSTIHGMAITGLNCSIGPCPLKSRVKRGASVVRWDWCYTHAAIGGLTGLVPLKGTWVDTWSLY